MEDLKRVHCISTQDCFRSTLYRPQAALFIEPISYSAGIASSSRRYRPQLTRSTFYILSISHLAGYLAICPHDLTTKNCISRPVFEPHPFVRGVFKGTTLAFRAWKLYPWSWHLQSTLWCSIELVRLNGENVFSGCHWNYNMLMSSWSSGFDIGIRILLSQSRHLIRALMPPS